MLQQTGGSEEVCEGPGGGGGVGGWGVRWGGGGWLLSEGISASQGLGVSDLPHQESPDGNTVLEELLFVSLLLLLILSKYQVYQIPCW